ncbi:MAG TPA: hypothetical protein VH170_02390 [Chthoniobacterales bacterium]|jgi:hypothetical protein|nr:hypothetical protein [Chthoniobacterales bacterium]
MRELTSARRSGLFALAIALALAYVDVPQSVAQPSAKKSMQVFVAPSEDRKATTIFSSDVPTIYAFWQGGSLADGDKIKAIWIAEDIGSAGPKESKILEAEAKVHKPDEHGAFSLSRPADKAWPVGKYAVAIYINGSLAQRAKFTITQGVQVEVH